MAVLVLSPISAKAQDGRLYFAGYMGLNTYDGMEFADSASGQSGDFDYDSTVFFGGALGIKYESNLRLEAEISYRSAEAGTVNFDNNLGTFDVGGEIQSLLTMVNAYYDFDLDLPVSPYITGGIGMSWNEVDIDDLSNLATDTENDDVSFAWQIGTGLRYALSPDVSFSGGYRFLDSVDLEIDGYDIDYSSHEFRIGLEYVFPPN